MSDIPRAAAMATIDDLDDMGLVAHAHAAFEPKAHGASIDVAHLHRLDQAAAAAIAIHGDGAHLHRVAPLAAPAAAAPSDGMVRPLRIFHGHYHRLVLLASLEACVVMAALYAALVLRFQAWQPEALAAAVGPLWTRYLLCAAIFPACLASMGLYDLRQRAGFAGIAVRVAIAVAMAQAALMCAFYALPTLFVGRGVLGFTGAFALVGLVAVRCAYLTLVDVELFKRRIVVWGAGQHAANIGARLRRRADQRGFKVVGYLAASGERQVVLGARRIEESVRLFEYLALNRVEEIVVAMDDRRRGFPERFLRDCRMRGIRVRDIVNFLEDESGHVNVDLARPSWLIFSEGFRSDVLRVSGKRAFDIAASLALLVFLLPIALVAAVAIWIEDRGPVLYRQNRVGQHGRTFRMLKFRSMRADAESRGPVWAAKNDPRVTRVGAFIRRARIDEIPQVVNVLAGHMSLVGPRPERPEFVDRLARTIPFYAERHFVKPGITGWAQLRFPYGSSDADAREKLGFDLYYVKNHDLVFDLWVLLRTVEIVLFRVGSR